MDAIERKFLSSVTGELRAVGDGADAPVRVEGYASLFGGEPDSYGDIIAPGAYAQTIRAWNSRSYALPMLFQHGEEVVGKWVQLAEDQRGLRAVGELTPGHTVAANVAASLRHRALSGLSIGFRAGKADRDPKTNLRTLREIDLHEVSVVANPACEEARVDHVKAALLGASEPDVNGAIAHLRKARTAMADHCAAKAAADAEAMRASMQTAYDCCGSAMACLGTKSAADLQQRELRELFRETFGVSRRQAEEVVELLVKARGAGDGAGRGAGAGDGGGDGRDGRGTGDAPREEDVGAGWLAAIEAAKGDLSLRTFLP